MFKKTGNPYKFQYLQTGISGPGITEVYLPDKPKDSEILFKKEQKWTRVQPSEILRLAIRDYTEAVQEDPNYIHPMQLQINQWADQEWERSEKGVWFWNNGEATYITGFYYWYLTAWRTYFGYPTYRETDKEITYLLKFCEEDPDCYGLMLNTIRRYGKSSLMGGWLNYRTTRDNNHYSGMQGETDKKIGKFYRQMIRGPFRKLPLYYTPRYDTSSKLEQDIKFEATTETGKNKKIGAFDDFDSLESYIEFRSSGAGEYDQAVLHSYLMEEVGKCHGKDTPIKMFDGTVKMVQDVRPGELLMGNDSTPRIVNSTVRGTGNIYKIIPTSNKKAEEWTVNEDHIISCQSSSPHLYSEYNEDGILNIPIKDYLKFSERKKKDLTMFRVAVEYPEVKHDIDPYFLGLWLGDGSSNNPEITTVDQELVDWLCKNYYVTKKKVYNRAQTYYVRSGQRACLRELNLLNNKHIPNEFIIDSRENRLKLLAGLIDTDGYRDPEPNKRMYEIIQKNQVLAESIKELAMSLGFYTSLKKKVATMKRKDGSVYSCDVYRLSIFGYKLYEIPCKVERKKMPEFGITTVNAKDPLRYGFRVEFDKVDNYYGFSISGNRLYLLGDYTVTHNTIQCDVNDRWGTVKPCLKNGRMIRGKAFMGTTVEFMDSSGKGGRAYKKLFYESDFDNKQADGRTSSGLYVCFLPGDCAYEGFFDEWGHPMRERAKQSILLERESKRKNPSDYSKLVRQYPLSIKEIFYVNIDRCEFNAMVLQDRKHELESMFEPILVRGEFAWKDNKRFSEVIFRHNDVTGWAQVHSLISEPSERNLVERLYTGQKPMFSPRNDLKFGGGVDPIDHGIVIEGKGGEEEFVSARRSRPVFFIKRKYDSSIDGELTQQILEQRAEERFPYKTNRYVAMMDVRPGDPNVFYERVLMMCWYYGCSFHPESQKPGVINHCYNNGCEDFVLTKYVPEGAMRRGTTDGTPASAMTIQEYTGAIATYVEYFGHTIPYTQLIDDLLQFNPKKTTEYDYSVAMGFTELGERIRPKTVSLPMMDIHDIMPGFDEYGDVVA